MKLIASVVLMFFVVALLTCCSSGIAEPKGGPELAARMSFERWAQQTATPYRNISYTTTSSDGTFAKVHIVAWLRESASSDWVEKQADLECRKVGGNWQAASYLSFGLTPEESAKQKQKAVAEATAEAVEKETKERLLDSIEIANAEGRGDKAKGQNEHHFWGVPAVRSSDNMVTVEVQVKNPDSRDHTVHMEFLLGPPGGSLYPASIWVSQAATAEILAKASAVTTESVELDLTSEWKWDLQGVEVGKPVGCSIEIVNVY